MRQEKEKYGGRPARSLRLLWRFVLLLCLFAAVCAASCGKDFFSKGTVDTPHDRYLRAIFVLQRIGCVPAEEETVRIAERIKRDDAAESLLHHPDKIFVLRSIALELADIGRDRDAFPDAPLFEAYARMGLGEYAEARDLLLQHVVEHDYRSGRYGVLCRILEMLGDNETLLLIAAEWNERDPVCLPERTQYAWAARLRLKRYAEAKNLMLRNAPCMGPPAYVYAAAAARAEGSEEEARALLRAAKEKESPEAVEILWRRLTHEEAPAPEY